MSLHRRVRTSVLITNAPHADGFNYTMAANPDELELWQWLDDILEQGLDVYVIARTGSVALRFSTGFSSPTVM